MKSLLIISPSFPPVNAADMHRVRQSVSYFEQMGWKPTVVTVECQKAGGTVDKLLSGTLPHNLEVITVSAFSQKWTQRIGLGSVALRSMWFYYRTVNALLRQRRFDLIYFSTTMFPVMVLGACWKSRFGVPYVIDMQDPWHSDHYLKVPKSQRPPKFWFSYRLNKWLEPIAMRNVSGIVAVSQGYCDMLQQRYANISSDNCAVIPFGAFERDFEVLNANRIENPFFSPGSGTINIAYVGRGGHDMGRSLSVIFGAFKRGLNEQPDLFKKIHLYFIGTSYAPNGQGKPTIAPLGPPSFRPATRLSALVGCALARPLVTIFLRVLWTGVPSVRPATPRYEGKRLPTRIRLPQPDERR